jgi:hypothetical protein
MTYSLSLLSLGIVFVYMLMSIARNNSRSRAISRTSVPCLFLALNICSSHTLFFNLSSQLKD